LFKLVFWNGKQQYQTLYNDITERKQAELHLREQKALTDRILESTPSAVAVVGQDQRVVKVNKAFEETFELTESKAEGKEIGEIIPVFRFVNAISQVLANGKSQYQIEFRIKRGILERVLVADIISMQKNEVMTLLRDVTDEREMQESLYLTDRLASVGEMAAGIAHELNNPLTGVVALSQLLLESGVPDGMKEDLETIRKEGQRAASIVKNLLSFARSHTTSIQAVDINAVICEVLNLRAYEDKSNNIEITTHLDSNLPEIMVDRFQMQQVFLNIVLNAEQAMKELECPGNITVTSERLNGFIRISFADSGPGIPPEIMNRIFDPFFTTKEVGKGTGLGLSISYGIIANQGGKIYARSRFGKGATFVIELPLNGH
jgi:PAS domain S-box-containing protein